MQNISEFTYHHVRISPAQQAAAHSQPTWEMSLVVKGSGHRIIGDMRRTFREGDLVLIPPAINHCWYFDSTDTAADGNIENITLMFESDILKSLALTMPSIKPLFDRLVQLDTALTFPEDIKATLTRLLVDMGDAIFPMNLSLFVELLVTVANNVDTAISAGKRTEITLTQQRLKRIETYVACNFSANITLEDIASHIGMNKTSLCCMFKRHTGQTLLEYITDKRLDHARYLLSIKDPDESIASICYKAGFQSVSHFNHLFKRAYGLSPRHLSLK